MKKLVKTFFPILIIVAIFSFLVVKYKPGWITGYFQNQDYSRRLYVQGLNHQKNDDFRSAYYSYRKISGRYKAHDIALLQMARSAAAIEDEKTAIKQYKKLLKSYPDSPSAALASYSLGQAYLRYGKKDAAKKQFIYTMEKFPETEYAIGSLYYLGEHLKYIKLSPSGRFAMDCYEELKASNQELTPNDKKCIAIALFMNEQYREALKYLSQLPLEDSWYYKAMCYKFLKNKRQAITILRQGMTKYSESDSKLKHAMWTYVELNTRSKYRSWSNIQRYTSKVHDFVLYQKAQNMGFKRALPIYREIAYKYPDSQFASDSLWNVFWNEVNNKNYNKAIELGKKHLAKYKNTKAAPAVYFWMGKIQKSKTKQYHKAILSKYPDSYYAFRLKEDGWTTSPKNKLPTDQNAIRIPHSYKEIANKHGESIAEIMLLQDYDTAMLFIKDDPFLESWIKQHDGVVTNSIVTARNAMIKTLEKPNKKDAKWQLIYPIYYAEKLNHNAKINNIDPILALSLMREESHFNPSAVSSANAHGLMQLLPSTARFISRSRYNDLFDPAVNIKLGTAYMAHTRDEFNGDMLLAVAAYNAGPGAVKSWVKRKNYDDMDRFIENIPYLQTKNYVKKVFGSYWNYKRIYGF